MEVSWIKRIILEWRLSFLHPHYFLNSALINYLFSHPRGDFLSQAHLQGPFNFLSAVEGARSLFPLLYSDNRQTSDHKYFQMWMAMQPPLFFPGANFCFELHSKWLRMTHRKGGQPQANPATKSFLQSPVLLSLPQNHPGNYLRPGTASSPALKEGKGKGPCRRNQMRK